MNFLQLQCGGAGMNGLAVCQTGLRPGNASVTIHLQYCGHQCAMETKLRVKPVSGQTAVWVNIVSFTVTYLISLTRPAFNIFETGV